jgi:hypothetical protein
VANEKSADIREDLMRVGLQGFAWTHIARCLESEAGFGAMPRFVLQTRFGFATQ